MWKYQILPEETRTRERPATNIRVGNHKLIAIFLEFVSEAGNMLFTIHKQDTYKVSWREWKEKLGRSVTDCFKSCSKGIFTAKQRKSRCHVQWWGSYQFLWVNDASKWSKWEKNSLLRISNTTMCKIIQRTVTPDLSLVLQIGEDLVMVNKFDSLEPVNGQPPPTEVRKSQHH